MTRRIRTLAVGSLVLFGLLAAQVNYLQVIAADDLANRDENKRLLIEEYEIDRGRIIAGDRKTVLARSRDTDDALRFLRRYPHAELYAHLTGYHSFVFGRAELEQSQNPFLAGRAAELFTDRLVDEILGRARRGADVLLAVDPVLQEAAAAALGGRAGGVAAVDPRTGDVLALVANPTYDPNELSSHDGERIRAAWERLNQDPAKPLLSNASDELFAPGSTFKVITAAAALENGMTPQTTFPNPRSLDLPLTTHVLDNFGGSHCLGGAPEITLADALRVSCNVTFGQVGLQLGAEALVGQAHRFGFSGEVPFDIPFAEGQMEEASFFEGNTPRLAISAIGQGDVRTNPLHMALVAAAVGNGGEMMRPRLVREVRDPDGRVLRSFDPEPYGRPLSPENAAALADMMEAVVASGTGGAAQIPGVAVAGKTGTGQVVGGDPHAWFLAFAPVEDPRIAVAVVVLNGGDLGSEATGGAVAAPIARAVLEAALG